MLGQGICSSQDLFNYITDGETKLDEEFNCLKNIDNFQNSRRYYVSFQEMAKYVPGQVSSLFFSLRVWPPDSSTVVSSHFKLKQHPTNVSPSVK